MANGVNPSQYDLFFLYRTASPDKDWVRQVAHCLEKNKEGYKCGYHERDFQPGKSIFDNIEDIFSQTKQIVVVMSPMFIESDWTKYETKMARTKLLNREVALSVIPVMLQDCKVPDALKDLTYLDVQQSPENWWPRLMLALGYEGYERAKGQYPSVCTYTELVKRFCVTSATDESAPILNALHILADDTVLATDSSNKKVKRFAQDGELMAESLFPSGPSGICEIDVRCVSVIFPTERILRILDINDTRIINNKSEIDLKVGFEAQSIDEQGSYAIVTSNTAAAANDVEGSIIHLIAHDGVLLRTIKLESEKRTNNELIKYKSPLNKFFKKVKRVQTKVIAETLLTQEAETMTMSARTVYETRGTCVCQEKIFSVEGNDIRIFHLDGRFLGNLVLDAEIQDPKDIAVSKDGSLFAVAHQVYVSIHKLY